MLDPSIFAPGHRKLVRTCIGHALGATRQRLGIWDGFLRHLDNLLVGFLADHSVILSDTQLATPPPPTGTS